MSNLIHVLPVSLLTFGAKTEVGSFQPKVRLISCRYEPALCTRPVTKVAEHSPCEHHSLDRKDNSHLDSIPPIKPPALDVETTRFVAVWVQGYSTFERGKVAVRAKPGTMSFRRTSDEDESYVIMYPTEAPGQAYNGAGGATPAGAGKTPGKSE